MKKEIRKINKAKRGLMDKAEVFEKSKKACRVFLGSDLYKNAKTLMLYMPLGNETDTTEIINASFRDGKKVIFPVTDAKSGEITPCYGTAETEFKKGAFSISEPCSDVVADMTEVDVVVVPGIALSKNGARLGFGKGCYDRLLKNTSAIKIGFCYEFQLCEEIPVEEHDIKMDYIITEKTIYKHKN